MIEIAEANKDRGPKPRSENCWIGNSAPQFEWRDTCADAEGKGPGCHLGCLIICEGPGHHSCQICLSRLWQIRPLISYLLPQNLAMVTHATVTPSLYYRNCFYVGLSLRLTQKLLVADAECCCTPANRIACVGEHSAGAVPSALATNLKVLVLTFKALYSLRQVYLRTASFLMCPRHPFAHCIIISWLFLIQKMSGLPQPEPSQLWHCPGGIASHW